MLAISITALFIVTLMAPLAVIAHSIAQAIPAWKETKAALAGCGHDCEVTVRTKEFYAVPRMPRTRTRAVPVVTAVRRLPVSMPQRAAA